MKKIDSIDLFAGIGGIRMGFENAFGPGFNTVFVSEWDKYAQKTYLDNFKTPPTIAGDITKVDEKDIPPFDICLAGFPCLTADSLILTDKGYKHIISIDPDNDFVFSKDAKWHKINALIENGSKNIYEIRTKGSATTHITEEHEIYARNGKNPPEYISVNSIFNSLSGIYYVGSPINTASKDIKLPDSFPETNKRNLMRLIGIYLRCGYINKSMKAIFHIFPDETEDFVTASEKRADFVYSSEKYSEFKISKKDYVSFLSLFGTHSYDKNIPGFIFNLSKELIEEMLKGYFGNKRKIEEKIYDLSLAYSLAHCIEKVYHKPCFVTKVIDDSIKNTEDNINYAYILECNLDKEKSLAFYEDGYMWYPITSIRNLKHEEQVYDLHVDGDPSFVTNHFVVHNCQAFSMAGSRMGFQDNYKGICRGTLFLDVARICEYHHPKVIFCENVKGLLSNDRGKTFKVICKTFEDLGYKVFYKLLNSKNFGVPQQRERVYIVAFRNDIAPKTFEFPDIVDDTKVIRDILEADPVSAKYYISDTYWEALKRHKASQEAKGNGFGYDIRSLDDVANTIVCGGMGKERNLIIDKRQTDLTPVTHIRGEVNKEGIRKLTPREWARLQAFPDTYILSLADTHLYKQLGNSVTVSVIEAIAKKIKEVLEETETKEV